MLNCGVKLVDILSGVIRFHKFSLYHPDSILWIERFVAAGADRSTADLTNPLPAATLKCDGKWKTDGDEQLNAVRPVCHS